MIMQNNMTVGDVATTPDFAHMKPGPLADYIEDACMTYYRVYALLPVLEEDLHQHIHLENNIFLRGVIA